jgi:hypothetical protein
VIESLEVRPLPSGLDDLHDNDEEEEGDGSGGGSTLSALIVASRDLFRSVPAETHLVTPATSAVPQKPPRPQRVVSTTALATCAIPSTAASSSSMRSAMSMSMSMSMWRDSEELRDFDDLVSSTTAVTTPLVSKTVVGTRSRLLDSPIPISTDKHDGGNNSSSCSTNNRNRDSGQRNNENDNKKLFSSAASCLAAVTPDALPAEEAVALRQRQRRRKLQQQQLASPEQDSQGFDYGSQLHDTMRGTDDDDDDDYEDEEGDEDGEQRPRKVSRLAHTVSPLPPVTVTATERDRGGKFGGRELTNERETERDNKWQWDPSVNPLMQLAMLTSADDLSPSRL